jgi:N,N'-diacetylbacillosaminyl-diphospho-undecaprenol alpha-1,3-N-acetylgalactosaminyltransferase
MKVVFLDNHNEVVWRLRHDLFTSMIHNGCEITALLPEGSKTQAFKNIGVNVIPIPVSRFINPVRDLFYLFRVYRLLRKIKPDIVYTNTIKPNTFGMIAAQWAGISRRVGGVSGIGRGFDPPKNWKDRLINRIVLTLYRMGGRRTDMFWFQNPDDYELFNSLRIVPKEKSLLVRGSGVNTNDFSPNQVDLNKAAQLRDELKLSPDTVVITMIGRVDWPKGVGEFLEASRIAGNWERKVCFLLVGFRDPYDKKSIGEDLLLPTKTFRWLGKRDDIKNILAISDIVTLPSYYREGVPRSLLEGMAMGKPIVTTDSPGCRETVENGVNGFLVPPKNSEALATSLRILVDDVEKRKTFGEESLRKAREEFSCYVVHKKVLQSLFGIQNPVIPDFKTTDNDDNVVLI